MFGVFQWTAKYDEAFCFQRVHERCMFSPSFLFSHRMVSVPPGSLFVYHDKVSHFLIHSPLDRVLERYWMLVRSCISLGQVYAGTFPARVIVRGFLTVSLAVVIQASRPYRQRPADYAGARPESCSSHSTSDAYPLSPPESP